MIKTLIERGYKQDKAGNFGKWDSCRTWRTSISQYNGVWTVGHCVPRMVFGAPHIFKFNSVEAMLADLPRIEAIS